MLLLGMFDELMNEKQNLRIKLLHLTLPNKSIAFEIYETLTKLPIEVNQCYVLGQQLVQGKP